MKQPFLNSPDPATRNAWTPTSIDNAQLTTRYRTYTNNLLCTGASKKWSSDIKCDLGKISKNHLHQCWPGVRYECWRLNVTKMRPVTSWVTSMHCLCEVELKQPCTKYCCIEWNAHLMAWWGIGPCVFTCQLYSPTSALRRSLSS